MDSFLRGIERTAYRMALFATRNREDALDLVQEAMCRFVANYRNHRQEEWKPLFYTILHNRLRDHGRWRTVRRCLCRFGVGSDDGGRDWNDVVDPHSPDPEHSSGVNSAWKALQQALSNLPARQREAFLLRAWEDLSVADTARIMGISQGSVKTHYHRAIQSLQHQVGDHWP